MSRGASSSRQLDKAFQADVTKDPQESEVREANVPRKNGPERDSTGHGLCGGCVFSSLVSHSKEAV